MEENVSAAVTEAMDAMSKVAKIIDYLSNETSNTGLAFILDACCEDLVMAGVNLQLACDNDLPGEKE
ncbi:MAG: hypothetical protein J0653_06770 [Deltaproteobacteria bacterium]|nr:hypothetical protein [Deltaproteobacteria bacterium]